ncbi:MAG TPA: hypothetical protein VLT33_31210, partial [Labilithrix sp.]|nr:hypothetical protein [Labilithrix sp.]
ARNGEYAAGGSCATHRSLVGVCAHPRSPIGPADKGGLHKKVYSYEVAFDRGTNRVQARAFAKSACDGLSGSWTDAPSTAGRATVNQVLPLAR